MKKNSKLKKGDITIVVLLITIALLISTIIYICNINIASCGVDNNGEPFCYFEKILHYIIGLD